MINKKHILEKLEEFDFSIENIALGDFDYIGEYTAKKNRQQGSELYKSAGCFFRPNYERGILLYSIVSTFEVQSYLEIGFGRGYSAFCVAKAMCDKGIDGKVLKWLRSLGTYLISWYYPTVTDFVAKDDLTISTS